MKAAPFDYIRADHLDQALELLNEHGGDAKLIAGGQSLVPMMAMRLARPGLLIDINRLESIKVIQHAQSGGAITGAAVRQCDVERNTRLAVDLPLVRQALRWVGHQQTRNRGTIGGSLAYADPSAELPLAALVLGATLNVRNHTEGERTVAAEDFFLGPMFTALGDTDCLVSICWPVARATRTGSAFEETAIRHGDFAMASAACQLEATADGLVSKISMGLGGVSGCPLVFPALSLQLIGKKITPELARAVAQEASAQCDPGSDMHAGAAYRRALAATLLQRVLCQAYAEAV